LLALATVPLFSQGSIYRNQGSYSRCFKCSDDSTL
jgi:hypothetical protein